MNTGIREPGLRCWPEVMDLPADFTQGGPGKKGWEAAGTCEVTPRVSEGLI